MTVDPLTGELPELVAHGRDRQRLDDPPRRSRHDHVERPNLQSEVLAALLRSGYAALASIGCEVSGERVILFGAVPTYHLKQLAQVFAQRVDGVGKVINRIAVFA